MSSAKVLDAGDSLMITAHDQESVEETLQAWCGLGATVISEPVRVGNKWVASCSKPANTTPKPDSLSLQDAVPQRERAELADRTSSQSVSVADTGTQLLISGPSKGGVQQKLAEYRDMGAKVVSEVVQVGALWMASCEHPDVAVSACTVESIGFSRLVKGPTKQAVAAKLEELCSVGATLVGEIEEQDGVWVGLCDTGGIENFDYKWR
jgi:hypothetical protein